MKSAQNFDLNGICGRPEILIYLQSSPSADPPPLVLTAANIYPEFNILFFNAL